MLVSILPLFYSYRLAFLHDIERIRELLDLAGENVTTCFESWVNDKGVTVEHIGKLVSNEMETTKP